MASFSDALAYPMEGEEWTKTVLIGGVLSVFAFLLLPVLVVYGYLVRVLRHRLDGDPEPPAFGEWAELLVDGLQVAVIGIVYLFVPGVVGVVVVGGSVAAMATGTRGGTAAGIAGLLGGFLLTFALVLVFGYVAVAAIVNFAREERLGAAFDFATLKPIVLDSDYAIAWLLSVALFVGVGVLSGLLNLVPLLGVIISAFIGFYAQIVAAHLWASGYSDARDGGEEGTDPDVGTPTV